MEIPYLQLTAYPSQSLVYRHCAYCHIFKNRIVYEQFAKIGENLNLSPLRVTNIQFLLTRIL